MKLRVTLTIALTLSVVGLSLMSFDTTARAQPARMRRVADTGVVTRHPNQTLRLVITWGDGAADPITVRFRRMGYMQEGCNSDGVCKFAVASQSTSDPIMLMPGEAASFDIDTAANGDLHMAVRGVILGTSLTKDLTGTLQIIDKTTGQTNIIAILIAD